MKQVRYGVFETNSSSTHSLTLCTTDEYRDWRDGNVLLNTHHNGVENFVDKDAAKRLVSESRRRHGIVYNPEDVNDDDLADYGFETYDDYWNNCEFETFYETKKLHNGEEVVAFGYYGYDG